MVNVQLTLFQIVKISKSLPRPELDARGLFDNLFTWPEYNASKSCDVADDLEDDPMHVNFWLTV